MANCPWCEDRELVEVDDYLECSNYMCHYARLKKEEEDGV